MFNTGYNIGILMLWLAMQILLSANVKSDSLIAVIALQFIQKFQLHNLEIQCY